MKAIKYLIAILFISFTSLAIAQPSPITMLQNTSDQVISSLKENKASLKSNPQVVYSIITNILLPHIDLDMMARSVIGRDGWSNATPDQRERFKQEFTKLLIRTYSSAFAAYSNETVKFMPIRGGITGSQVQVSSMIVRQDGPSIPVDYRLIWRGSDWKMYDFSVDGVSMIESFRSQFSQQLSQGGMNAVIQALTQHNAKSISTSDE